ncbi:hypothetical protein BCR44DRAFT_252573 [Catenaria anguillulae PL171]|uniref:Uncharacterized protein n=1 Tax=Catenaria anguillulae PL171 TaxID=765915 RepID=A0A1Y2HLG7_9FUNG|nr:hypothetical protein BCR44DRAFT_252573 [Catenaria anguillulae PL171]
MHCMNLCRFPLLLSSGFVTYCLSLICWAQSHVISQLQYCPNSTSVTLSSRDSALLCRAIWVVMSGSIRHQDKQLVTDREPQKPDPGQ